VIVCETKEKREKPLGHRKAYVGFLRKAKNLPCSNPESIGKGEETWTLFANKGRDGGEILRRGK